MNFVTKIKDIFGAFWTNVFKNTFLIDGIANAHALLLKKGAESQALWEARINPNKNRVYEDRFPFVIYITRVGRDVNEDGSIKIISEHEAASLVDVLNDKAALGQEDTTAGYSATTLYDVPEPWYLTDHIVDYTKTLFSGVDFEYSKGRFIFYKHPEELGLEVCRMPDQNGRIRECYKMFGWSSSSSAVKEYAEVFESDVLAEYGQIVWRMHQEGATVYNSKLLLAAITGMVTSDTEGTVTGIWFEQGFIHIKVDDEIYSTRINSTMSEAIYNDMIGSQEGFDSYSIPDEYLERCSVVVRKGDKVTMGSMLVGNLKVISGDNLCLMPKWVCNDTASVLSIHNDGVNVFVDTGVTVYNAPSSWECLVQVGDNLRLGQNIFNPDPSFDFSNCIKEDEIEGIEVATPVGTLMARNKMMKCRQVTVSGKTLNVIPLEGDASDAYAERCAERFNRGQIDNVPVPYYINPMVFITKQARGATVTLIYIKAEKTRVLEAAFDCIKRNTIASSLLDIHIAEEESL